MSDLVTALDVPMLAPPIARFHHRAVKALILLLTVVVGIHPAPGQSPSAQGAASPASVLVKLTPVDWTMPKATILAKLAAMPGVQRGADWQGYFVFKGGELLGHPVVLWRALFSGEKLARFDVDLPAPGTVDEYYDQIRKELEKVLGRPGTVKREGDRRISTWKSPSSGVSGKGEVAELHGLLKHKGLWLHLRDSELTK
jgi:hypothetical protein